MSVFSVQESDHRHCGRLANRVIVAAFILLFCAWTVRAEAQDLYQYASVRFPYEESNQGVDFFEMYRKASVLTSVTRAEVPNFLNLPFGKDAKQAIDLYVPKGKLEKAPVVLFVHGGGFEEGDRAHYGYVAGPLAPHGIITAVAGYRLVSRDPGNKIHYSDVQSDVRQAIIWLYRNVAKYGGNPSRIYLVGHSVGGMLVADLGLNRKWLADAGIPTTIIAGTAPMSGAFTVPVGSDTLGGRMREIEVNDPAPYVVITYGSKDFGQGTAEGQEQTVKTNNAMVARLAANKSRGTIIVEPNADHAAAVIALANKDSATFKAILAMIQATRP